MTRLLLELWGHGGPLSNLSLKTVGRSDEAATAPKGFVARQLHSLLESTAIAFCPPREQEKLANLHKYRTPQALATALGPMGHEAVRKHDKFVHSFVLGCGPEVWGEDACAQLCALIRHLRGIVERPSSSWLSNWYPLLTHQHGDLNSSNVLVSA